jgi:O-acetylhomoserine/O-acetylserine sulfhydrylase-like pyridoxal-dependent enzyme
LGGSPLAVADVRKLAQEAHAAGKLLVVDNSIATSAGCAAVRLGADVVVERLDHACGEAGEGLAAWAVARSAASRFCLPAAADLSPDEHARLQAAYERHLASCTRANDAALAMASYLVCHPRIAHVWYPGLLRDQRNSSQRDESNAHAPSILTGGFGHIVDYATADVPDDICRIVCGPDDPFIQIERIERHLACP